MSGYFVEVRDESGEWWTIGKAPFPGSTREESIAEYRRESGDTETPDDRIRAVYDPILAMMGEDGGAE
jgi:hypothetical protein